MNINQFVYNQFSNAEEVVAYLNDQVHEFNGYRQRGYATTPCLLMMKAGPMVLSFNDIPECAMHDYTSTPQGQERVAKFVALGHAEQNAIAFAARKGLITEGATMALAWFPCINCASLIVQAGIEELIATIPNYDYKLDQYDFRGAEKVLRDAGVHITFVKKAA